MTNSPEKEKRVAPVLWHKLEPLRAFLDDPNLTEVCVNRPCEVWTEGRSGWQRHEVPELTFEHLKMLVTVLSGYNNKAIDAEKPIMSASLPDGQRVQVIIPPACEPNTISITIRKPSLFTKSLDELEAEGAFDEFIEVKHELKPFERDLLRLKADKKIKKFLVLAVQKHRNILVVGQTGSGKTTFAKSLIQCIPPEERLVTIEGIHELFLENHANRVHLFYAEEGDNSSKVTSKQVLASCLRMKPDRILLAELRGDESWEYVKSINTGHPGSISTMHANGAFEAFEQLTALIKDSPTGVHLDANDIKHRLFTTIDVVVYYHNWKLHEIYYEPERKYKYLG